MSRTHQIELIWGWIDVILPFKNQQVSYKWLLLIFDLHLTTTCHNLQNFYLRLRILRRSLFLSDIFDCRKWNTLIHFNLNDFTCCFTLYGSNSLFMAPPLTTGDSPCCRIRPIVPSWSPQETFHFYPLHNSAKFQLYFI